MISSAELKVKGLQALTDALGLVNAERFLVIMQQESFDYTEWQKTLFEDMDVDELSKEAMTAWKQKDY